MFDPSQVPVLGAPQQPTVQMPEWLSRLFGSGSPALNPRMADTQIPNSIYNALGAWARGGSPAEVRKVIKMEGWSMPDRINSMPYHIQIIDPSGTYHLIPNSDF
jgi:hypothetical protein